MRLSTRARYGLRLCFLVGAEGGGVVPLSSLVAKTGLSQKYLEQILSMLKNGGVLESKRGASGGYLLKHPPQRITLKSILAALDDDFAITDCATGDCSDEFCPNKGVMKRIYDTVDKLLTETTLLDMINEQSN